jgi:HEAT repeat protein
MPLAEKLVASLRQTQLNVFWDRDSIPAESNWEDVLDAALEQSRHIIVILTPASVKSEEVTAEWRPMLNKAKNIVPVLYLPCEIPRRLSMRQYIDFQDSAQYLVSLANLVATINNFAETEHIEVTLSGAELIKRGEAYFAAGQPQESVRDYLLALRDQDSIVRKQAAILVGKTQNPEHIAALLNIAEKESTLDVKVEILDSVRKLVEAAQDNTVLGDLLSAMMPFTNDSASPVRRMAFRVLAYSRLPEVVPILTQYLLSDPADEVRYQIALGLGRFNVPESTNTLIKALSDSSAEVRRASARALGVHGKDQAIPALRRLSTSDKDREVRLAAGEAIENIRRGTW